MFEQLTQYSDIGLLLVRIGLAVIFIYHAIPKVKNSKGMAQMVGMPVGMVLMLGMLELLASLGLIVGLYVQLSALILAVIMLGAIGMKMMKWHVPFAAVDKTGWELDFILFASSIALILAGGGSIGIQ